MRRTVKNRVILVTGAGIRVGRALAEGLAAEGAHVALHCHGSVEKAETLKRQLQAQGRRAEVFVADLTQPGQIEPLLSRVEDSLGPLDALVNSAALFLRSPFVDTSLDTLERQWALNARAPFLLAQGCARRMLGRPHSAPSSGPAGSEVAGNIVNIVDIGGLYVHWRNYAAYSMTKAALAAMTQSLAVELAPRIRVNAVAPGTVLPPESDTEQDHARAIQKNPSRRLGSPQDVFEAVHFLLTGPAYMTGQILAVDGGEHLSSRG